MQRLIYNLSGQTLTHVPDVRRASATWVLEDLLRGLTDAARTLDSDSATVDAASQTTTADAGPTEANPRAVDVTTSAAFAIGRTYEIVGVDGELERVRVSGLEAATIHIEHPLLGIYPTGSTIRGVELVTSAIADAVVQDDQRVQSDRPMRIVWTYSDGSRFHEGVRVAREDRNDQLVAAIISDVRDIFPDVNTRLVHHGRPTLEPTARVILKQLRGDLLTRGIKAEELLAGDKLHWSTVWRVLWHLAQTGNAPASVGTDATLVREWATYCKGEHERFWLSLTVGQGGPDVIVVEPTTSTAPSSVDSTYRRTVMDL